MGFKEDIDNLKSSWNKLSLLWKVVLVLMLGNQVLSIGSLQDQVIKTKGFFLDGIDFYRRFTNSLVEVIPFGIDIPQVEIDAIVLLVLFAGVMLRVGSNPRGHFFGSRTYFIASMLISLAILVVASGMFIEHSLIQLFVYLFLVLTFYSLTYGRWKFITLFLLPFVVASILAAVSNGLAA